MTSFPSGFYLKWTRYETTLGFKSCTVTGLGLQNDTSYSGLQIEKRRKKNREWNKATVRVIVNVGEQTDKQQRRLKEGEPIIQLFFLFSAVLVRNAVPFAMLELRSRNPAKQGHSAALPRISVPWQVGDTECQEKNVAFFYFSFFVTLLNFSHQNNCKRITCVITKGCFYLKILLICGRKHPVWKKYLPLNLLLCAGLTGMFI